MSNWPTLQDLKDFLIVKGMPLRVGDVYDAEATAALGRGRRMCERITRRSFALDAGTPGFPAIREYPSPGTGRLWTGWMQSVASVVAVYDGAYTQRAHDYPLTRLGIEWHEYPDNIRAFRSIFLPGGETFPSSGRIIIEGVFGLSDGPPADVARAALMFAAAELGPAMEGGSGQSVSAAMVERRFMEQYAAPTDGPYVWKQQASEFLQPWIEPPLAMVRRAHGQPGRPVPFHPTTPR